MADKNGYSRRGFFKIAGALGAGSILVSGRDAEGAEKICPQKLKIGDLVRRAVTLPA
jgi:hypothetical protein